MNASVARTARPRAARVNAAPNARPARGCVVEAVESRILFHLHVDTPLSDVAVNVDAPATTIDLSTRIFDEVGPTVRISTVSGDIDVGLYDRATPLTVANFLNYVNSGRYNGTVIHRTEPLPAPFVIQGGGYLPSGTHVTQDASVQNEFSPTRPNVRGTLAMAKSSDPNSATSEWFVNLANNTSLDSTSNSGGFTTFGEVLGNGMAVADAIDALPRVNATGINGAWNHFPVTQATSPPLPTLSTTNANDAGTPTTPTQAQMVMVNGATVIAARHAVTYTVQSTDPALVSPSVSGNNLTLTYGAGLRGFATVTVTATEEGTGASTTDSFDVTVGTALNVNIGQGANAQTVVFTDADGTVATIRVAGGSAIAAVSGNNLAQATSGRTVTVSGSNLGLSNLVLAGNNPNVTIQTVGGSDGRITLGGVSAAGPARGVSGRGVVLRGNATFTNAVGRLDLAGTQGATITIQRSGSAGFVEPSITIGTAVDTDIDSQAPLKLRLGTWGGTDAEADTITAPAVRNLQVGGDFSGGLDVSGNGQRVGSPALTSAKIAGALASGTWNVGRTSRVSAGSVGADWAGTFADVANFAVAGDLAGDITANSVKVLNAGSITGANIRLNLAPAAGAMGLGRLASRGAITNSLIRSTADIGTVNAGAISGSSIYAGVAATEGGFLPSAVGDFASASSIRGVTVRNGGTAAGFVNSDIAASTLGRMNLGVVQVDNAGVPFGLAADTILSLTAIGAGGAPIRTALLTSASQSLDLTDFEVRVF